MPICLDNVRLGLYPKRLKSRLRIKLKRRKTFAKTSQPSAKRVEAVDQEDIYNTSVNTDHRADLFAAGETGGDRNQRRGIIRMLDDQREG